MVADFEIKKILHDGEIQRDLRLCDGLVKKFAIGGGWYRDNFCVGGGV